MERIRAADFMEGGECLLFGTDPEADPEAQDGALMESRYESGDGKGPSRRFHGGECLLFGLTLKQTLKQASVLDAIGCPV